jgi:hypothetical protein
MALENVPTDVLADDLIDTYQRGIRRLEASVRAGLERGLDPNRVGGVDQARGDATLAYRERQLRVSRTIVAELRAGATSSPIIARRAYESALYATDRVTLGEVVGVGGRFGGVHQRALTALAANMSASLERAAARVGENVEAVFARANAIEGAVPVRGRAAGFVGRRVDDPWRRVGLGAVGEGLVTLDTRKQVSAAMVRRLIDEGVADALTGFVDKAGRRWSLDTYAETVARTTTREATSRATANRLLEHGLNLVTISHHPHLSDECSPFDGQTFALDPTGDTQGYPVLAKLTPFHPRCRHVTTPAGASFEAFERELGLAAEGKAAPAPPVEIPDATPAERIQATIAGEREASIERAIDQATGRNAEGRARLREHYPAGDDPAGLLELEDRYRARGEIAPGLALDEEGIRNVGAAVRGELAGRLRKVDRAASRDIDAAIKRRDAVEAEMIAVRDRRRAASISDPDFDEITARYVELTDRVAEVRRVVLEAQRGLYDRRREAMLELLGEVRPGFGEGVLESVTTRGEGLKSVREAARHFPREWVEASNFMGARLGKPLKVTLRRRARAWYSPGDGELLTTGELRTSIHELGHRLEDANPAIRLAEALFYRRRTTSRGRQEASEHMGSGYRRDEVTRPDKFFTRYVGKDYGGRNDSMYEVLTMGAETLFTPRMTRDGVKSLLELDRDHAEFILGLLTGV